MFPKKALYVRLLYHVQEIRAYKCYVSRSLVAPLQVHTRIQPAGGLENIVKNKRNKQIILLLLSFTIPFIVMTLGGIIISIAPFGENGFLVSDIDAQFAAFFTYWKDNILSSTDAFKYSFEKTLGGDMTGFSAYYLHNPYLFILMFFSSEKISVGIYWMISLMISSMGLTFEIMLDRKYGADYRHLMFSVAYALSGYSIAYLTLPIYFFSLIMFPIVILGIDLISESITRRNNIFWGGCLYSFSFSCYMGQLLYWIYGLYFRWIIFFIYYMQRSF